jgi:hypothetical protein
MDRLIPYLTKRPVTRTPKLAAKPTRAWSPDHGFAASEIRQAVRPPQDFRPGRMVLRKRVAK